MEAIRLEFQTEIKAKILELVCIFSSDELKIVPKAQPLSKKKECFSPELIKSMTVQKCFLLLRS